jgi:4-hydroxy-L-threonine phosphate dehydrogenase PdxA
VELAYISESYDGATHFLNATFKVTLRPAQRLSVTNGEHVVAAEWVPLEDIADRIVVDVVREPLLAYLRNAQRYAGFHEAGITIEWPADSE